MFVKKKAGLSIATHLDKHVSDVEQQVDEEVLVLDLVERVHDLDKPANSKERCCHLILMNNVVVGKYSNEILITFTTENYCRLVCYNYVIKHTNVNIDQHLITNQGDSL